MLKRYEDAMRAAAKLAADADRDTRRALVKVKGREERFSEKLITLLEDKLDDYADGGVKWSVITEISDKQNGQEKALGADIVITVDINFDGFSVRKGFLVQAKINQNTQRGFAVDNRSKLNGQCDKMLDHTRDSYVFGYGEQSTKVISAQTIKDLKGSTITDIISSSVEDFFFDFFICRIGDHDIQATSHATLQKLMSEMPAKAAILIKAREDEPHNPKY